MIAEILKFIPLSEETVILAMQITGVAASLLSILTFFKTVKLSNSLSIAKATQFIRESRKPIPVITETAIPQLELEETPQQPKQKRIPLTFTIPEEAQSLLDIITVQVNYEDGWCGAPGCQRAG